MVLLGFYEAFAKFLADRWPPDQVALQLMTEPHGKAYGAEFEDWNSIYRQMLAAVRKHMPEHTIVIPGNRVGSVFGMTAMKPVDDDNVYYSFTTHEPFQFGMNARFGDYMGAGNHWRDISYMPWPSSAAIVKERMEAMIRDVKPAERTAAENDLQAYGNAYYNRQWLNRRAKHIRDWNDAHGGNLKTMVVEFGSLDHIWVRKFGLSKGVYPEERHLYLHDIRESLEEIATGWVYWSFNEACTVLNPFSRLPYGYTGKGHVEEAMLLALGLR